LITVLVYDKTQRSDAILEEAEQQAGVIFHQAGIEVVWRNCSRASLDVQLDRCRLLDDNHFVLSILANGQRKTAEVFGVAFLGEDGRGSYSDIFLQPILDLRGTEGTSEATLLGAVAAHEIGHLLLGPNSHSIMGVMSAQWQRVQLNELAMGSFWINPDQAARMRARVLGAVQKPSVQLAARRPVD